jgi:predicted Rossmann fold flavoprotein
MNKTDVIIIGAGAAGLMCAIEAGKRRRRVLVLDHANRVGKKILMSGGGRCNFTNLGVGPEHYISHNPHFHKSALSRYRPADFVQLVKKHRIPFHEKTLGQLFCDNKSQDIVNLLLRECEDAEVSIRINTAIGDIRQSDTGFIIESDRGPFQAKSLVIATGGLSIPTMGASPFGYKVAEQFGLKVWPTRAGLVPLTLHVEDKAKIAPLAGVSVSTIVESSRIRFQENMLFTHRGLSGPAILQTSSYWQPGEKIVINFLPECDLAERLKTLQQKRGQSLLKTILAELLPKNVVAILHGNDFLEHQLGSIPHKQLDSIANQLHQWIVKPNGTEGYRTAEVTLGGVDCDALSSQTMAARDVPGLYFIGEVVDVSGWLGGYNFQWAWASGWAAGQVV